MVTFIDLFAGIGGFHSGLTKAGMECVGWCEQDKYAQASYRALYPTDNLWFSPDIRALNGTEMPYADLWCFGFPCQDVSIAGLKDGMGNTRSGLFYEVMRLLNERKHKPKWLLIENVKNLLSIDNGWGFYSVLSEMDKAGYSIVWRVYNTKDFGLPQNRERVFIIGHLGNDCPSEVLYRPNQSEQSIIQVGNIIKTTSFAGNPQRGRIYSPDGLSPTLTCVKGGGIEPKILLSRNPNVIRKLTPREFWRLQGFTDEQFSRVRPLQSDAQLYKQAGNSVSIPIVYELGKNIIEHHRRLHDSE